jgi:hypothetical protein
VVASYHGRRRSQNSKSGHQISETTTSISKNGGQPFVIKVFINECKFWRERSGKFDIKYKKKRLCALHFHMCCDNVFPFTTPQESGRSEDEESGSQNSEESGSGSEEEAEEEDEDLNDTDVSSVEDAKEEDNKPTRDISATMDLIHGLSRHMDVCKGRLSNRFPINHPKPPHGQQPLSVASSKQSKFEEKEAEDEESVANESFEPTVAPPKVTKKAQDITKPNQTETNQPTTSLPSPSPSPLPTPRDEPKPTVPQPRHKTGITLLDPYRHTANQRTTKMQGGSTLEETLAEEWASAPHVAEALKTLLLDDSDQVEQSILRHEASRLRK